MKPKKPKKAAYSEEWWAVKCKGIFMEVTKYNPVFELTKEIIKVHGLKSKIIRVKITEVKE